MNLADGNSQKDNGQAAGRKEETLLEERRSPALESNLPGGWRHSLNPGFRISRIAYCHSADSEIPAWENGMFIYSSPGLFENDLSSLNEGPNELISSLGTFSGDNLPAGWRSLLILIE